MSGLSQLEKCTFPKEMCDVPLWLIYRLVDRGDGKFAKPPVSPITGEVCSKTDEGKYTDFNRALLGVEQHDADGVGFVFLHGFMAIDLDNCFKEDGTLTEQAADIFDHFSATYAEFSPSGNGIHIFCQGEKPNDRTRVPGIEVYTGHNFVTVTGHKIPEAGDSVLNMQSEIEWLFEKYLPTQDAPKVMKAELVEIEHGDKTPVQWLELGLQNDEKLKKLYYDTDHVDDESGHDLALMCKLAFWLNRDVEAVEEAFFNSPWVHSKDYAHLQKVDKRSDYLERTLTKAFSTVTITAFEQEKKFKNIPDIKLRIAKNSEGELVIPLEDYTDVGNAKSFAEMYAQNLAYTQEWGWCYFTGFNWETAQNYQAQQCAVEFGESVMYIAKEVNEYYIEKCVGMGIDPNSKEGREIMAPAAALLKHATRTQSAAGIRALLELAEGMMLTPASVFDSNPWELNTPNVVVDLRTGEVYPPAWNHFNTMMTDIVYNPKAESQGMWLDFLNTIFCKDQDLINYVQLQLGAACVGKVYEEQLLIANGCGSNGKSTMFGILYSVLGDYAMSVNPDILMGKINQEQQIAAAELKGKRLCIAQETESGQVLSSSMVKRMVSTDNIIGRKLYQAPIEFKPTHSLMLATNHLPQVKDNDEGTWRRLTVLPFNAHITGDDIITNYQDVLLSEDGEYILKWLVEGAIKFYQNGCSFGKKPYAVMEASNEYRNAQRDSVDVFIEECIQEIGNDSKAVGCWVKPDDLYQRYLDWSAANGLTKPMSKIGLSKALKSRGMKSVREYKKGVGTAYVWKNILLKNEDGSDNLLVE